MKTMRPLRWARIAGSTACVMRMAPKKFTSNRSRACSSEVSSTAPTTAPPALLTRRSMRPALASTSATPASMDVSSRTSRSTRSVPAGTELAADLAVPKTRYPRPTSARAVAFPMPDDTPVTIATRPFMFLLRSLDDDCHLNRQMLARCLRFASLVQAGDLFHGNASATLLLPRGALRSANQLSYLAEVAQHRSPRRAWIVPGDRRQDPLVSRERSLRSAGRLQSARAAVAQKVHQQVEYPVHHAVPRRHGDDVMELGILLDAGLCVPHLRFLASQDRFHPIDLRGSGVLRGTRGQRRLEDPAHVEKLVDELPLVGERTRKRPDQRIGGEIANDRARALARSHEAHQLQRPHRVPHGAAADVELPGELALRRKLVTGLQVPERDLILDLPHHVLGQVRAADRLQPKQNTARRTGHRLRYHPAAFRRGSSPGPLAARVPPQVASIGARRAVSARRRRARRQSSHRSPHRRRPASRTRTPASAPLLPSLRRSKPALSPCIARRSSWWRRSGRRCRRSPRGRARRSRPRRRR